MKKAKNDATKKSKNTGAHKIHQKVSFERNCNQKTENCWLKLSDLNEISGKRHPENGLCPTKKSAKELISKPKGETKKILRDNAFFQSNNLLPFTSHGLIRGSWMDRFIVSYSFLLLHRYQKNFRKYVYSHFFCSRKVFSLNIFTKCRIFCRRQNIFIVV